MYPAYNDFGREIKIGFALWRVYMHLQPPTLNHHTPTPVKILSLTTDLKMSPRHAIASLDWLVRHGYLIEAERSDPRAVREFVLAWARTPSPSAAPPSAISLGEAGSPA